jgi:hypothetical protein
MNGQIAAVIFSGRGRKICGLERIRDGELMKGLWLGVIVYAFLVLFSPPAACAVPAADPKGQAAKPADNGMQAMARTAFIVKGKDHNEWLFIRMTSAQYSSLKAHAHFSKGAGKLSLHPRQRQAIGKALKVDKPIGKVVLKINIKHILYSEGLKGHYVARSAGAFSAFLKSGHFPLEEKEVPKEQPDENLLRNFKELKPMGTEKTPGETDKWIQEDRDEKEPDEKKPATK